MDTPLARADITEKELEEKIVAYVGVRYVERFEDIETWKAARTSS